jgi:hypothetical protein
MSVIISGVLLSTLKTNSSRNIAFLILCPFSDQVRTKIYSERLSSVLSTAAKIANKDMYLR